MTPDPTQRDARDAEMEALREAEAEAAYIVMQHVDGVRCDGAYPDSLVKRALDAYRDTVAASVRAELLQSGTPVWVATEPDEETSDIHRSEPTLSTALRAGGYWMGIGRLPLDYRLTEPGTCVEARVVLVPGGTAHAD